MSAERRKKRILVADDDEDLLNVTRSILEFAGYKVDTARDGKEALKEIKRRTHDLLVLDVIMPRIDGVRLFQTVKKSDKHKDIPVLFLSGYPIDTMAEERRKTIVERADAYIQKPFRTKEFLDTVHGLLRK